jgi:hypothetical protein
MIITAREGLRTTARSARDMAIIRALVWAARLCHDQVYLLQSLAQNCRRIKEAGEAKLKWDVQKALPLRRLRIHGTAEPMDSEYQEQPVDTLKQPRSELRADLLSNHGRAKPTRMNPALTTFLCEERPNRPARRIRSLVEAGMSTPRASRRSRGAKAAIYAR